MQKLNSNLLQKVSSKKTSVKDSILFTIVSFAALYGLIYALCTIITLIDLLTF